VTLLVGAAVGAAGCGEEATPIDEVTTTQGQTPHLLEPTEQMEALARQQCLDDPNLAQGEVRAVDPARPEDELAAVVVDCAEVRAATTITAG
jgi:hypothetical protein